MSNTTKSCPYCGEEILFVAIKCKHCQSMLNEFDSTRENVRITTKSVEQTEGKPSFNFKKYIIAIFVVLATIYFSLSINHEEIKISYLNQPIFSSKVIEFSKKYLEKYQFVNEISATRVRQERYNYLKDMPKHFKNWDVVFVSASTNGYGSARTVFRDLYNTTIFYVANLKPDDVGYAKLAGIQFGTLLVISGSFVVSSGSPDYVDEDSITEKGSMMAPEFVIKLDKVEFPNANNVRQ